MLGAIGLGLSALSAYAGYGEGKKNEARQRGIDAKNEAALKAELDETVRRTEYENKRYKSNLIASSYSSGFKKGGSTDIKRKEIVRTQENDLDWMKTAGSTRLSNFRFENQARLRQMRSERRTGAVSSAGGVIGRYNIMKNNGTL